MRTRLLAVLAAAVAVAAVLLPAPSSALTARALINDADVGAVVTPAPASGTLTFSLNTISAKCSSSSVTSSPFVRPACTTRTMVCPATAASCDLQIAPARQSSLHGLPSFNGGIHMSLGWATRTNVEPYHCNPSTNVCQTQILFTGLPAGSEAWVNAYNEASGLAFPTLGVQAVLIIH